MTINALVIDEQPEQWTDKKTGQQKVTYRVTMLDWSDGPRCTNMLQFSLPETLAALKGRLRNQIVELSVKELRPGLGSMMSVHGELRLLSAAASDAPEVETKKAA